MGILMSRLAPLFLLLLAPSIAFAQGNEAALANPPPPESPVEPVIDPDHPGPENAPDGGPGRPVGPRVRYPGGPQADEPAVTRYLRESAEGVPLYLVFEEMIEELTSELQDAPRERLSPMAVRRVRVSPQLSAWYADQIQAQIIASIQEHTPHTVRRCVRCDAIRSRVEDDEWVVTLGVADQEQLRQEAQILGVRTFMDIRVAYYPRHNVATLLAEVISAEDGTVEWSRSYRSDATTAAILRTGDRIESREERVEELERRLDQRPYLEHQPLGGAGLIPYSGEQGIIFGAMLGYRMNEHFGEDRRWIFSLAAEIFANFSENNPLIGGFANVGIQYDILPPNLNDFVFRLGAAAGAFFAGQEGNSFVGEITVDGVFQFMLGVGISAFYFVPVEFAGADLGGFGGKARFTITIR
jgi:hypothetical protein